MTKLKDDVCHSCLSWPCRCRRNEVKRKNEEELIDELIEAIKHLIDQFPESDLGYPTAQVDYEGDQVEGHLDDQTVWAIENVKEKLDELEAAQTSN